VALAITTALKNGCRNVLMKRREKYLKQPHSIAAAKIVGAGQQNAGLTAAAIKARRLNY
jgi:hypothetical protein